MNTDASASLPAGSHTLVSCSFEHGEGVGQGFGAGSLYQKVSGNQVPLECEPGHVGFVLGFFIVALLHVGLKSL